MIRSLETLLAALALSFVCACASGSAEDPSPSRADCQQLRAHVVDLRLPRDTGSAGEVDKHRANLIASLGDGYVDACTAERTPEYVACALAATSRDELARCR